MTAPVSPLVAEAFGLGVIAADRLSQSHKVLNWLSCSIPVNKNFLKKTHGLALDAL